MFQLVRTARFERRLERFLRLHSGLRLRLADVFRALAEDPFQARLGLHALSGDLAGLYAVRLTYAYRIIILLDREAREIVLLDIGSHDEVYR